MMNDKQAEEIIARLDDVKKLLILSLLDKGFKQGNIARTLGVSQPTISRMFPKGALNKVRIEAETE